MLTQGSTPTSFGCLKCADSHRKPTTYSLETMSIGESSRWKRSCCCSATRSSSRKTSSSCVETTSAQMSLEVSLLLLFAHLTVIHLFRSVRLLRRMQAADKYQDVENFHRRIQCPPHRLHCRFKNLLRAWWTVTESEEYGRHTEDSTSDRCSGLRAVERLGMVRSVRHGSRLGGQ